MAPEKVVGDMRWDEDVYACEQEKFAARMRPCLKRHLSVLDYGCGIGRWTFFLSEDGRGYVGYDPVPRAIEIAEDLNPRELFTTDRELCDNADLGWTCTVLQHLCDSQVIDALSFLREKCERLILVENVSQHNDRDYIYFRTIAQYVMLMRAAGWIWGQDFIHVFGNEAHGVIFGEKK